MTDTGMMSGVCPDRNIIIKCSICGEPKEHFIGNCGICDICNDSGIFFYVEGNGFPETLAQKIKTVVLLGAEKQTVTIALPRAIAGEFEPMSTNTDVISLTYRESGSDNGTNKSIDNNYVFFDIDITAVGTGTAAILIKRQGSVVFQSGSIRVVDNYYASLGWSYFFRNGTGNDRMLLKVSRELTFHGDGSINHYGIDIVCQNGNTRYTNIYSPADGIVRNITPASSSAGNAITIETKDKAENGKTIYFRALHMENPHAFNIGAFVAKGDFIGQVGNTGESLGNHLHADMCWDDDWPRGRNSFTNENTIAPSEFFPDIPFIR
jgi:hypothetical protein